MHTKAHVLFTAHNDLKGRVVSLGNLANALQAQVDCARVRAVCARRRRCYVVTR
jgi:hypothetical protein